MCKDSQYPLKLQSTNTEKQQVLTIRGRFLRFSKPHPLRCVHSHHFFEGDTECIVTTETTLVCQLLGGNRLVACGGLMVEIDKVLDAQTIDIAIVSDTLRGKVLAEVGTVNANQCCKLGNGDIVLQIESRFLTMLLQQGTDVLGQAKRHGHGGRLLGFTTGAIPCDQWVNFLTFRDAKIAQRLYSPQEIANQYDVIYLNNVVV